MNLQKQVILEIDVDGKVTLEVKGVQGKQCLQTTAELEKLLGGKVLDRQLTAEATQQPAVAGQTLKLKGPT